MFTYLFNYLCIFIGRRIFDRCSRSFYFDQLASNTGALAAEAPIGLGMKCTVLSVRCNVQYKYTYIAFTVHKSYRKYTVKNKFHFTPL